MTKINMEIPAILANQKPLKPEVLLSNGVTLYLISNHKHLNLLMK